MTHCPVCSTKLDRSEILIAGLMVLRCRECKRFAVEPPPLIAVEWIPGGPDVIQRLKDSAQRGNQTAAIVTSEDDDLRWERGWM